MHRSVLPLLTLCALAAPAAASPITLPGTWFQIELPSGWTDQGIHLDDGADLLHGPDGEQVGLYHYGSCQAIFDALTKVGAVSDYGADFLPSGWTGKTVGDDHLSCRDRTDDGNYAMAVRESGSQVVEHRGEFLALFAAIDAGHFGNGTAYGDDVATLPASGIRMHHAPNFSLVNSDAATGSDVFHLVVDGKTFEYTVRAGSSDCDSAVTAFAGEAAGSFSISVYPWSHYTPGGKSFFCMMFGTESVVVQAPSDRSEQGDLLHAIDEEMTPPFALGPVETLPISKWRVSVPDGWKVTSEAVVDAITEASDDGDDPPDPSTVDTSGDTEDLLTDDQDQIAIGRPSTSCDAILGSSQHYDPTWLPVGWRAATDGTSRWFCTDGDGGPIEVRVPDYEMRRPQLVLLLQSLAAENAPVPVVTPTTPETPTDPDVIVTDHHRGALLPVPIILALQTVGLGSDRGWGVRVAAHYSRRLTERLSAQVGGELAYDTVTKLDHDLGGDVELFLTSHVSALALVGHDQLGTGDDVAIAGAWYYGFGGAFSFSGEDRYVGLHLDYLWRSQPAAQGTTPVDTTYYPGHEWRLGGEVSARGNRVSGWTVEYRSAGDASTILIGLVLRL